MAAYTFTPFTSLHDRPGLISLEAARRSPEIKYRSVDLLDKSPKITITPVPKTDYPCTLIPLAEAAARDDIRRFREGFEIRESWRRAAAMARYENDEELTFRCFYC